MLQSEPIDILCLQRKGYKTKMKTLEEVLKGSKKMEAKLIGYDETPTDIIVSHVNQFKDLNPIEVRSISQEVNSDSVNSVRNSSSIRRMVQPAPQCGPPSSDNNDSSSSQAPTGRVY